MIKYWRPLKLLRIPKDSKTKILKGLTNQNILFVDHDILYKNLNPNFDIFIDRLKEEKIIRKIKSHPKIHYFKNNICVRDYKKNIKKFEIENTNKTQIKSLFEKIEELNSLTDKKFNIKEKKKKLFSKKTSKLNEILKNENFLNKIENFLKKNENSLKKKNLEFFKKILTKFYKYRNNLHNHILAQDEKYNTLCHNDLTLDNIFVNKKDEIFLLDFEYSEVNPFIYEFSNFFLECKMKFTEKPPFFEIRKNCQNLDFLRDMVFERFGPDFGVFGKKEFYEKIEEFEVFSHFFWINVTIMSGMMDIDLDLYAYAEKRLELMEDVYFRMFC